MPSFDVVSEVDMHELSNAVDQANREVATRYDFKGSDAKFERAVVLWPMKGRQAADLFALTSMGSPHVVSIDKDTKRMEDNGSSVISNESARAYVLDYLQIEGHPAVIPDLRLISNLVFQA